MNGAVAYIILSNKMNPETDKDSITQALNNDESISGKIMGFYFDKYKFVMHDVNLKNAFESVKELKIQYQTAWYSCRAVNDCGNRKGLLT